MKKKLLVYLLALCAVVALAFGLSACGETHTHTFEQRNTDERYLKSAADCTHKAVYYYSCECGEKGKQTFESGEVIGHSFINYKYNDDATCTSDGTKTAKCERCTQTDTVKDETHLKTAHTFTQEKAEAKYLKSEATCTHKAVYYKSCSACGAASETDTFESGELTEHSYTRQSTNEEYQISKATCTAKAVYYYSCATCGKKGAETFESGATAPHDWNDNVCLQCQTDGGGSRGLNWTLNDDESAYILTGIGRCGDKIINVPSVYNGLPVTGIGDGAFSNGSITGIEISEGVKTIGVCAFYNCNKIRNISLADSITDIGENAFGNCEAFSGIISLPESLINLSSDAFDGCVNLAGVSISENNISYASQSGILYNKDKSRFVLIPRSVYGTVTISDNVTEVYDFAFSDNKKITGIIMGSNVKNIGSYAFRNCTYLKSVTFSDGVENIGENAFENCIALTDLFITKGIARIDDGAFVGCSNVKSVTADGDNKAFVSSDGVLYDKPVSAIVYIPQALEGSITIPEGVTEIGSKAFDGRGITSVILPKTLKRIESDAFSNCSRLTYNLHSDVLYLGSSDNWYFAVIKPQKSDIYYCEIHYAAEVIAARSFKGCSKITSIIIPTGVKNIDDATFSGCTQLSSITISGNITSVGNSAFQYCKLTSVTIGKNVTSIGDYAFYDCNLAAITFEGTTAQWKAIVKGVDWNNYFYCTVTCTDGKLNKDGNEIT